jgi:nucleoid DNA-binding protein
MAAVVEIPQVIEYVLSNPQHFPGRHNLAQERTSNVQPILQPFRQMHLIWDSLTRNVRQVLESGKSVNIDHFGYFTFQPIFSEQGNQRNIRESQLSFRPCFMASKELAAALPKYIGKQQVMSTGGSVYQQGVRMTYLNSHAIGTDAQYDARVVADAVTAIFKGVAALCKREYCVDLHFGFASVLMRNGNLRAAFKPEFTSNVQRIPREWPTASVSTPVPAPRSATEGELASLSDLWNTQPTLSLTTPAMEKLPEWRRLSRKLGSQSLDLTSTA